MPHLDSQKWKPERTGRRGYFQVSRRLGLRSGSQVGNKLFSYIPSKMYFYFRFLLLASKLPRHRPRGKSVVSGSSVSSGVELVLSTNILMFYYIKNVCKRRRTEIAGLTLSEKL